MSSGRPLEFDPDAALGAAMRLFWAQGYKATSMQGLLDGMGIARSSFYQAFRGKRQIFLRAIDRYRENLVAELRAGLAASGSGLAFLRDTLDSVAEDARRGDGRMGCLVFNSAAEFGQRDPGMAAEISMSIDAFASVFSEAVRRAQRDGEIDPHKDPELLGRHVVCAMSGLRTLAKAGATPEELAKLAELAAAALR
ncbi:TetR/AcrR family transcriptional regulator [Wenzhouxiangella sp. XN24]|uniref:TetR/AcrR family transcriptional regulator n=1 Tax=Wenzhouxiangella sp. XN24 TaxID=2713569 RepID=UPI0013EBC150|nr:TetR/AcrR family transcriptional regulator [Wenzhouxiangella sp. XN24]NGX14993.1 TetR/AcrR family transcriptional regulator [Wenzhouxiangella sp. XN24]